MQPLLRLLAFMSIHVALHHVTHYKYDRPVQLGPQVIRLRPAPHSRSRILSYSLRVEPTVHFINWQQDPFSNYQARLVFPQKTTAFKVTVDLVTEMAVFNPFDFFLEPSAEHVPLTYEPALKESTFFNSRIVNDLEQFKAESDVIVANRITDDVSNVFEKVYSRDLFGQD
jgi:transglutaminase-like putative cysteine protease